MLGNHKDKSFRNRKSGMTLIEIVLVIGLIVMIMGLVVGNVGGIFSGSKIDLAGLKVRETYKLPLTQYRVHMGNFPNSAQGLQALLSEPENSRGRWRGPYIEGEGDLEDPWGNKYQYAFPGTHNKNGYDLYSFGPDGVQSDDDIANW